MSAMDDYVETWDINNIKRAQQQPLVMIRDHMRENITIQPYVIQDKYTSSAPLQFEIYSKNFYHFLNFNKAMLTAIFRIEFVIPNMQAALDYQANTNGGYLFEFELPYNTISIFEKFTEKIGSVDLHTMDAYGLFYSLQSFIKDTGAAILKDALTWRFQDYNSILSCTMNAGTYSITRLIPAETLINRLILDAEEEDPQATNVVKYIEIPIQIPIVTILEACGYFPCYMLSDPIRLTWYLQESVQYLKHSANVSNVLSFTDSYLTEVVLDIEAMKALNVQNLDDTPVVFTSVCYEYIQNMLNRSMSSSYIDYLEYSARWRNVKNVFQIALIKLPSNSTTDKMLRTALGYSPYSKLISGDFNYSWNFAGYNWPYQNGVTSLLTLYKLFMEYYGKYDDNGLETMSFMPYQYFVPLGCSAIDFSTLTQTDSIISGISTKSTKITQTIKGDDSPIESDIHSTEKNPIMLHTWFGRNVIYIIRKGGFAKLE